MTDTPLDDVVAQQYNKWTYPEPIQDLEEWAANGWQFFDPSHAYRIMWPGSPFHADLDILIAGCGTNQAAQIAYMNRGAKVVAVDVSEASLAHERWLKDKYGLKNLELHLLPIEEIPSLNQDFDLVMSTGVLHHMDSPKVGMKALADVMRPDAVAAIMLYARNGRIGVELMQAVFRDLGLKQDEESLERVKEAIGALHSSHPILGYLSIADDLNYDGGVVDTFLHGRDVSFTVEDCIDLVTSAGLVFQDWLGKSSYYPPKLIEPTNGFFQMVDRLPRERMWSVMERFFTLNACHFFLATRPDRPEKSYRIDFSTSEAADYIPVFNLHSGVRGQQVFHPGWNVDLDPTHLAFVQHFDGATSIREIAGRVRQSGIAAGADQTELEAIGVALSEALWRRDFIAIELPHATV